MKLDFSLTPLTKINLKWIRDLNVRSATVKLSGGNIEKNHPDVGWPMIFFNMTPKAGNRNKNKQVDQHQTEKLPFRKKQSTKWKGSLQNGREYLQTISIKYINKKLTQLSGKKKQLIT